MITKNARRRKYKSRAEKPLNRQAIKALQFDARRPENSQQILWDRDVTGFGVRVYANGGKRYVVRYSWPPGRGGKQRIFTLGRVSARAPEPGEIGEDVELGDSRGYLMLEEARALAERILTDASRGRDPVARIHAERRHALDFAALVQEFLPHASPRSRSLYERRLRVYALSEEDFAHKVASQITRGDVTRLRDRALAKGCAASTANRLVATISTVFRWAAERELVPPLNPCATVKKLKENCNSSRSLSPDEVGRIWAAAQRHENPYLGAFFRLALLLGTRRTELLRVAWAEVDFDTRTLMLNHTKSGRPTVKPLPAAALEILRALPRDATNPHVFPGERGKPIHSSTVNKTWRELCRAEGISDDANLHGVRTTLGSWQRASGQPMAHISAALTHSSTAITERVYSRARIEQAAAVLEQHAEAILAAAESPQPGPNVH